MKTSPAERRRLRHREDARRAILDASEALLLEAGYEAFSMRRVAERCGYTAPTLYHYFSDKRALLDALLEERLRRLMRQLRRAARGDDALEDLRAMSKAFVRFARRNPSHYQLLTAPRDPELPPLPSEEEARLLVEKPLRALDEARRLASGGWEATHQALWVLLHGLISLPQSQPDVPWVSGLEDLAIDTMLRGAVRPAASDARPRRPAARAGARS